MNIRAQIIHETFYKSIDGTLYWVENHTCSPIFKEGPRSLYWPDALLNLWCDLFKWGLPFVLRDNTLHPLSFSFDISCTFVLSVGCFSLPISACTYCLSCIAYLGRHWLVVVVHFNGLVYPIWVVLLWDFRLLIRARSIQLRVKIIGVLIGEYLFQFT